MPDASLCFIGDIAIDPPTVLAPMEGLTDGVFRGMIRSMGGCGLVVTEFIHARQLSLQTHRAMQRAEIADDGHPVAIQIYGHDPEALAQSAELCQQLGADLVDINMGCPSKAVTRHCSGVALMRNPRLARSIIRAVRSAITIPLTVKMRLGWDHTDRNARDIAYMCQEEGVDAVSVHGRTRADLYKGKADWEAIGEVKQAVRIPVIGNGDVQSAEDALTLRRIAGVDGIMAGRGVLRNPWLLRQISEALAGKPIYQPNLAERREKLLAYYTRIQQQIPHPGSALGKMKKVAGIFTDGQWYAKQLRYELLHARSVAEAEAAVHRFFDEMEVLEAKLGLDVFTGTPQPRRNRSQNAQDGTW